MCFLSHKGTEAPCFLHFYFTKDLAPQRIKCIMIVNRMPIYFPKKLAKKIRVLLINDTLASDNLKQ